jgi:alpha-D-ribose 1-methylphosphonate 5-phosphate C-P lyase
MAPSPIPRFDNPKMHASKALILLGAGREKKIYAVPPFTKVASLDFEDHPFEVEAVTGRTCRKCGAQGVFMDEIVDSASSEPEYQCNDTSYCASRAAP